MDFNDSRLDAPSRDYHVYLAFLQRLAGDRSGAKAITEQTRNKLSFTKEKSMLCEKCSTKALKKNKSQAWMNVWRALFGSF
jgi:hypothetical protein